MQENSPDGFPPLTLTIMRALCALTVLHPSEEGQESLTKALDELYREYWLNHRRTNDKDVLEGVLTKVLGKEDATQSTYSPPAFVSFYLSSVSYFLQSGR